MKRAIVVIGLLVAVATLSGQTAKVVSLDDKDANAARQAYDNLQRAQKAWDDVRVRMNEAYLVVPEGDADAGAQVSWSYVNGSSAVWATTISCNIVFLDSSRQPTPEEHSACLKDQQEAEKNRKPMLHYRRGWENGFEFTQDFRFIVPKPQPEPAKPYSPWIINPGTVTW